MTDNTVDPLLYIDDCTGPECPRAWVCRQAYLDKDMVGCPLVDTDFVPEDNRVPLDKLFNRAYKL